MIALNVTCVVTVNNDRHHGDHGEPLQRKAIDESVAILAVLGIEVMFSSRVCLSVCQACLCLARCFFSFFSFQFNLYLCV